MPPPLVRPRFALTPSTPPPPQRPGPIGAGPSPLPPPGANDVVGVLEGRFVRVPTSFVQGLEVGGTVSAAFGRPRQGELLQGTVGPAVSVLIPASGPLRGNGPLLGARFRRDTKKSGSLGLQIDYAPLKVTTTCTPPGCEPHAVLFAAGYEASVVPAMRVTTWAEYG